MDKIICMSINGFTGIMYGNSSLSIYNADGDEVMYTGFRSVNTPEELQRLVDAFPAFWKALKEAEDD